VGFCDPSQPTKLPVVVIPGFASSVLEVRRSQTKREWEGRPVWVAVHELIKKKLTIHKTTQAQAQPAAAGGHGARCEGSDSNSISPGSPQHLERLVPGRAITERTFSAVQDEVRKLSLQKSQRGGMAQAAPGNDDDEDNDGRGTGAGAGGSSAPPATSAFLTPRNSAVSPAGDGFPSATSRTGSFGSFSSGGGSRRATVKRADSFVVKHESTQSRLAKAHPLVRHLTLGPDGVSDPPGIRVRAKRGLEAIMCVCA
jgi:hypothetical protein